jgi:hypothetical protein
MAWCNGTQSFFEGDPAVGKLRITWPDGSLSVVHLRLRIAALFHTHGNVRTGIYIGDSVHGKWVVASNGGDQTCAGTSITKLGIGDVGTTHGITYSTLSFEHSA